MSDDVLSVDEEVKAEEAQPEEQPEAAPAEAEKPEEPRIEFTPEQQEFINSKIVADKVREKHEAKREAEEARRQAEELQAELQKLKQPERPEIPPMPEPFEDDYEKKMESYAKAVRDQAEYDFAVRQQQQAQEMAQQAELRRQQEELVKANSTFVESSKKLGIAEAELDSAVQNIAQVGGLGNGAVLANHLLADPNGPEIVSYLGKNLGEVEKLQQMTVPQAAVYIESLREKARRPAPETAPPPPEVPDGAGFPEGDGFDVEGATFL